MDARETARVIPASQRSIALLLVACWLVACLILIAMAWPDIARLTYPDPDDQLRLVEVRDFLSGQSWWDVSQHRINPPLGGPMHWSRLVDLPIAAVILLLRPLLGYAAAQTAAAVIVPLCTLGVCIAGTALLTRRLLDREAAIIAALLVCATPAALAQMHPLRVDHHGWQICLAVFALVALLDARPLRSGLIAGALVALWLRISLEGLPLAGAMGALVCLRWALARSRAEDPRLVGFFATLAGGSLLLFAITIPHAQWALAWCDSISAPHLALFATAFAGSLLLRALPSAPVPRIVGVAVLGMACLAVYYASAPRCGLDPFVDLEPIVRRVWFNSVAEGLPVWRQTPVVAALTAGYPLVALFGAMLAWRAAEGEMRSLWGCYLFVLAAATCGAILVQRMGGTANALALPGGLYLLLGQLRRARTQTRMVRRLAGTAAAVLLFAPVTPPLAALILTPANAEKSKDEVSNKGCYTAANFALLDALPTARILAPLDIGPLILLQSHHSVIATGHHRSHTAMADVLHAFIDGEASAHRIIRQHGVRYVVLCRKAVEVGVYAGLGPHSFARLLMTDAPPPWLQPQPVPGNQALSVWRVAD